MAKALLDTDDIRLLYADTNTFRLNSLYANNPAYCRHCILERTRKDGWKLIYDTAYGLIFEKERYWEIERPPISHVCTKQEKAEFLEEENRIHPENAEENNSTMGEKRFFLQCLDQDKKPNC